MEPAGNLKYPSRPVHLPSITYNDVAFFKDSIEGKYKLVLPNHGIIVPMDSNTSIAMSLPKKGVNKIISLAVNALAPCEDCDYEYGFQVRLNRKQPGVDNDEFHPKFYHFYGKLEKFTTGSGLIDAAYQLVMLNDLHTQMAADTDLMTYCTVGKVYTITLDGTDSATYHEILINNSAGIQKKLTVTLSTMYPALLQYTATVTNSLDTKLIATAFTEDTSITLKIIVPHTEELVSIIAYDVSNDVVADNTPSPVSIVLMNKTLDFEPEILFDGDQFVREYFSFAWVPSFAVALNHRIIIDGDTDTDSNDITATSCSTAATAIAAAINTTGLKVWGTNDKGLMLYVPNSKLDIVPLASAAAVTPVVYSQKFQWPQLTSDEVFKVFAHSQHLGELSVLQRTNKPADVPYVKITINYNGHNQASFHGASQTANASQRVYIYAPLSVVDDNVFAAVADLDAMTGKLSSGTKNSLASLLAGCTTEANINCNESGSFTDFVAAWATS